MDRLGLKFEAMKFEEGYVRESLEAFHADGWIEEVLFRVKGGKEATVYCCRAVPETGCGLLAAKIYRPRQARAMRNYGAYREGRAMTTDKRLQRAIRNKSKAGRSAEDSAWIRREFDVLARLHQAGVSVPEPVARAGHAILMGFVGTGEGAAPLLHEVRLPREEAPALFQRLLRDIETMLRCDYIHGDLSAFNVMVHEGDYRIIDFPQAVTPMENGNAYALLLRDVERICQYFDGCGLRSSPFDLADRMWRSQGAR
jgi:RIO kinase 1